MAKTQAPDPANLTYLCDKPEPRTELETKSAFSPGVAPARTRSRAPIADVGGDASAAALTDLSQALQQARDEGRLVQVLPTEEIALDHLTRDRIAAVEEELQALV